MPGRRIVIEGGLVSVVEERELKHCSTKEFMANLKDGMDLDTGLLPYGCIVWKRTGTRTLVVLEVPQRVMVVRWKNVASSQQAPVSDLRLSLPFCQFYVTFHQEAIANLHISCTKRPVSAMDAPVYILPLPNQFNGGASNVCTGEISIPSDIPLGQRAARLVNEFFRFDFNRDLMPHFPEAFKVDDQEGGVRLPPGMEGWDWHSTRNQLFGIGPEVQYDPMPCGTFERRCQTVLGVR